MKSLIRFEDTYGMADIFCAERGIAYKNVTLSNKIISIGNDEFISFGFGGIPCVEINKQDVVKIIRAGIADITFVIDIDDFNGNKSHILSYDSLCKIFNRTIKAFQKFNYNINFKFLLITYSSETIMLYQYITDKAIDVESYVHSVNTNLLHLIMIAVLGNRKDTKKAKRVRDYLNITALNNNITNNKSINSEVFEWLLSGCNTTYGYKIGKTRNKLQNIETQFAVYKTCRNRMVSIRHSDGKIINEITLNLDDKLYEIANQLGIRVR